MPRFLKDLRESLWRTFRLKKRLSFLFRLSSSPGVLPFEWRRNPLHRRDPLSLPSHGFSLALPWRLLRPSGWHEPIRTVAAAILILPACSSPSVLVHVSELRFHLARLGYHAFNRIQLEAEPRLKVDLAVAKWILPLKNLVVSSPVASPAATLKVS